MAFPTNINLADLYGANGFKLVGAAAGDMSGASVASAGDVNGDGFVDVIVGALHADPNGASSGASYVVFGKASGFSANLNLSTLDGATGFKLDGVAAYDFSGMPVASAGDVNGDGYDDLIVGAWGVDSNGVYASGASYVVFGKASGFTASLDLGTLNGSNGFKLDSAIAEDFSGWSVASAGDVNGDGFDDLVVGAPYADRVGVDSGVSFVVFGKAEGFASSLDLGTLNGTNGFRLSGVSVYDHAGVSVASAGDVNGDGFDDLIVGAWGADSDTIDTGASYVVFGKATGHAASLDLGALNGSNGFRLSGPNAGGLTGLSVASAGDVNGDGYDDLIVGSLELFDSYVVFGKASGFAADVDLAALNGTSGFSLSSTADEPIGRSVASAGDVNGDGYDDLIVGARYANGTAGASYVVFGKALGFASNVDLSALDGTTGFRLSGVAGDRSGYSVASAGDVNGDGYDDLIVGAFASGANGVDSGASYVVFGGAFGAAVTTNGTSAAEMLIGGALDDVLTGGGGADVFHAGAGDDRLVVSDLAFALADGGTGTDTLALAGAGLILDLTTALAAGRLEGIERIDLTGTGNSTLKIGTAAVLGGVGAVATGRHVLTVTGDLGDAVQFAEADWMKIGPFEQGGVMFNRWVLGNAVIDVQHGVQVVGDSSAPIVGGPGNDNLAGGDGDDTLQGEGGDDTLIGGLGADLMTGGTGDDTYNVDNAGDVVVEAAGGGTDTVETTLSSYTLGADVENLRFQGTGDFTGSGNELANALTGGAGNDTLDGGVGADLMTGGAGNDTYVVDNAGDGVAEAADGGTDTVETTLSSYTLGANVENLRFVGTGSFAGTGNELANTLTGGDDNDTLDGEAGADQMTGGAGDDTYVIDNAGDVVVELADGGTDTVRTGLSSYSLGANVEILQFTGSGNFTGFGNELANALTGGSGSDTLDGGAGADQMTGGAGNDAYYIDNAGDVVVELANGGTDTVRTSLSSYTLGANVEIVQFTGTGGFTGTGNELANTLTGGSANDTLDGGNGNDRLVGGLGADHMIGGAGNDTYSVDNVNDVVVEAADGGTDRVETSLSSYTLGANVEDLKYTGPGSFTGTGNELANYLGGGFGNDVLDGGLGDDRLEGGSGADHMIGGAGNDIYYVDHAGDFVDELADGGTDTVRAVNLSSYTLGANIENLEFVGGFSGVTGAGNDLANSLTGGARDDTLAGGLGDDTLIGGAGADHMIGGAGNDTYDVDNAGDVVAEMADGGTDTVRTRLSSYTLGANVENLQFSGIGGFTGTGNELANTLTGGDGNDTLTGGGGADVFQAGAGDDRLVVSDLAFALADGGTGTDTLALAGTGLVLDLITAPAAGKLEGIERLDLTGSGNNTLKINAAAVLGGVGAEVGGRHVLTVLGNAGDTVQFAEPGWTKTDSFTATGVLFDRWVLGNAEVDVQQGVSVGGPGGGEGPDRLYGTAGTDVLDGGDGNDKLYGRAGADLMTGGAGNDVYSVDNVGDVVVELAGSDSGTDTVRTSLTSYTLGANVENLEFVGTGGFTGTGNELANKLDGGTGDDVLDGGAGDDNLYGRAGADLMTGGAGSDTYSVDDVGDVVVELAGSDSGIDTVRTTLSSYTLGANVENLEFVGTGGFTGTGNELDNKLAGGAGTDVLDGGAGNDKLYGRAGADLMTGGAGSDTYSVDNVGDVVVELAGSDSGIDTVETTLSSYALGANIENLEFVGTGGFTGTGNELDNRLTGGTGDDVLIGGGGTDILSGGAGADVFVFRDALDSTRAVRDTINDFTVGQDSIDFTQLSSGGSFHALQTVTSVPATIDAHSLVAYVASNGNTVLYVNDTGTAQATDHASMEILLRGVTTLSDADLGHFLI